MEKMSKKNRCTAVTFSTMIIALILLVIHFVKNPGHGVFVVEVILSAFALGMVTMIIFVSLIGLWILSEAICEQILNRLK